MLCFSSDYPLQTQIYLLKQQNLRLISDCEHYQNCYKKQYEDNKTTIQLLEQTLDEKNQQIAQLTKQVDLLRQEKYGYIHQNFQLTKERANLKRKFNELKKLA